jgi:hypothetical protein
MTSQISGSLGATPPPSPASRASLPASVAVPLPLLLIPFGSGLDSPALPDEQRWLAAQVSPALPDGLSVLAPPPPGKNGGSCVAVWVSPPQDHAHPQPSASSCQCSALARRVTLDRRAFMS